MNRILALSIFGMAFMPWVSLSADAAQPRPNVVFVLYDDLGYGEPKCYREASEFRTPNIDRLASEGMRFTDAHSAASVCTPTRYGVLTGRYPSRIGQYGVLTTYSKPIIPTSRLTVPSLMRQHGYDTACFGKWHLGMDWGGLSDKNDKATVGTRLVSSPNAAGFDYFYGYTHSRNIGMIMEQNTVLAKVEEVQTQPMLATKIVEYLDHPERKEKPFFLYLPLCPPHTPIAPDPRFAGKGSLPGKPDPYADWIYQGDQVLGQVLEALDRHQLSENTLIIVTSDNGAAGRDYPPLRGAKTSIYEGGHRVPFVARWPARIKPGEVCKDTICLNDLMATCAELVGAKLPDEAGEDSFSILPQLTGTAGTPAHRFTIHQSPARDLAIRQGPWKFILFKSGKRELYHLETDIGEERNVLAANPEVVERFDAWMKKSMADGRSTPGAPQKAGENDPVNGNPQTKNKNKKSAKRAKQ